MRHSFDTADAQLYGVTAAIVLSNIRFWTDKNKANDKHIHDGYVYTYNSVRAWKELLPYLTADKIRGALNKLVGAGALVKGSFNAAGYDRTTWYGVSLLGNPKCIYKKSQMHLWKIPNLYLLVNQLLNNR